MLFRTVEENLRIAMRCYSRVSDAGEARDYPGLTVASSGIDCSVFNSAMLTGPAGEIEFQRALALAGVHFGQRRLGWTFWLCEDLLEPVVRNHAKSVFRTSGMCPIAEAPGMYAETLTAARRKCRLDIRRVCEAETRLDFAHLSATIFALPFQTAKIIYGSAAVWDGPMTGWVGYTDGRAVSIASVVIGAGVAGVYSVGTLPAYQGRGFAETLMRHALAEARNETGIEVSVLQSTNQGMNLYLRMGYRVVTRFGVYLHEGCGSN
jgi:ribosomal protein S18 acetylase RimI-like enzyme